MHVLESIACHDNLKIDLPEIYQKYYPLDKSKYITIDISEGTKKEKYDYWKIVLDMIYDFLISNEVTIYQIGENKEEHLNSTTSLIGGLDLSQKAYVMRNSLLHLGLNNISSHIASFLGTKTLSLFGSEFVDQAKPYWSNNSNFQGICPESELLPSQLLESNEINKVKPETIAGKIITALGGRFEKQFDSVEIGRFFLNRKIESSMSSVIPNIKQFGIPSLICRMDYEFNEKALVTQLGLCPCSIVTSKPIDLKILNLYKKNVLEILYVIDEESDPAFVSGVNKLGIKMGVSTYLSQEKLNPIKMKYMDFPQNITLLNIEKVKKVNLEQKERYFYKSNKFILHDGKMFASKSAMKRNQFCENFNPPFFPVYDEDDFWVDAEYYYLVEKNQLTY